MGIRESIIRIALANGATLAGISSMEDLKRSSSHRIYIKLKVYSGIGTVNDNETLAKDQFFSWPETARSILVIALSHPQGLEKLDWWDGKGGTPGNRLLIDIIKKTQQQIEDEIKINTTKLHYYVEKGGVFLKDAAVLAGLGCIGKNNLLVTREYGPRVRLRALFIDEEIEPTGPLDFDPCSDCKVYCRRVCPEKAIAEKVSTLESIGETLHLPARDGFYNRELCNIQMEKNISTSKENRNRQAPVKYCRKCELACPVGKPK
jgi:epoxyqueuosine reductase